MLIIFLIPIIEFCFSMEKSLLLDFTKLDPDIPPSTGLIIPTAPMSELRGFCVRYYVESLKNQQILTTVSYDLNLLMYFENDVGFVAIKGSGVNEPKISWLERVQAKIF